MRYIITWRDENNILEWNFHTAESMDEVIFTIENLKSRGVIQYYTNELGDKIAGASCDF